MSSSACDGRYCYVKFKGLKHFVFEGNHLFFMFVDTEMHFGKIQFKRTTLVTRAFHFQSRDE